MRPYTWLLLMVGCLGLTAFTEAPPERLQCAAVYGLIATGDASPRADSAQAARDQLTINADADAVKAHYDAAVADRDAGRLNPDEIAGVCDRAFRFEVAEASPLPYQPKSQTMADILNRPGTPTMETPVSPSPSSGAGFLYATCNGGKQRFDAGLSRDDLIQAADNQGCSGNDVNALLMAYDLLKGN